MIPRSSFFTDEKKQLVLTSRTKSEIKLQVLCLDSEGEMKSVN